MGYLTVTSAAVSPLYDLKSNLVTCLHCYYDKHKTVLINLNSVENSE